MAESQNRRMPSRVIPSRRRLPRRIIQRRAHNKPQSIAITQAMRRHQSGIFNNPVLHRQHLQPRHPRLHPDRNLSMVRYRPQRNPRLRPRRLSGINKYNLFIQKHKSIKFYNLPYTCSLCSCAPVLLFYFKQEHNSTKAMA